ncbi:hypothetical protein [Methylocapsa sp. S129]|uniref:hypothetical protein n=1 Tax=Methylocapsa sp. S129 TaxID=1641869 RepID=UPI00131BD658|nr:hypothetical protein [Methylocapsa sp. S129]
MGFSLLRAAALVLALIFLVASGGLDSWWTARNKWISRGGLVFLTTLGALLVVFLCGALQSVRYDELPQPYPVIYLILVRAWPLCVMAGAFWRSRALFILAVAGALFTSVFANVTWDALHERYRAEAPLRQREADEARAREIAPVMTALARVPREAGVEPLLDFILRTDPHEAYWEAMRRIEDMPDAFEQLQRLLDGGRSLDALYVLSKIAADRPDAFPEATEDRAWVAAARIARDMTDRTGKDATPANEIERLCASVDVLVYNRKKPWTLPERRRAELTTVRDWMEAAATKDYSCSVASNFVMDQALAPPPGGEKP